MTRCRNSRPGSGNAPAASVERRCLDLLSRRATGRPLHPGLCPQPAARCREPCRSASPGPGTAPDTRQRTRDVVTGTEASPPPILCSCPLPRRTGCRPKLTPDCSTRHAEGATPMTVQPPRSFEYAHPVDKSVDSRGMRGDKRRAERSMHSGQDRWALPSNRRSPRRHAQLAAPMRLGPQHPQHLLLLLFSSLEEEHCKVMCVDRTRAWPGAQHPGVTGRARWPYGCTPRTGIDHPGRPARSSTSHHPRFS
jgi:hypothetical protein